MSSDESRWNPGPVPAVGDRVQMQDSQGSRGWMRARCIAVKEYDGAHLVTVEGTDGGGVITAWWGSKHFRSE